jgi:hypothetical protein
MSNNSAQIVKESDRQQGFPGLVYRYKTLLLNDFYQMRSERQSNIFYAHCL